jgi:hypothetical protein
MAVAAFLLDWLWLPLNYCGIAKECLASSAAHEGYAPPLSSCAQAKEESHECG